ncbi:MAG: hypothetical protein CM15mP68_8280 [Pseudomonadota bacterium]|nr:MAG: hypothetical protein CM15mP68_8280 [Pseudomonadota bacterium]
MKKRFLIALFLLLLLSTYKFQTNFSLIPNLSIKKITIENNYIIDEENIKKKLAFLYDTNLFLLKTENIKIRLNEIDFIESYEIKKIYPNKIRIRVFEKKPIAVLQHKKNKFFFTSNGGTANFLDLKEFQNLPVVFGDKKSFDIFYKNLIAINFPINEIKNFYLFDSKRWDLVTIKNQTIKLPINDYDKSLLNYLNLKDQANFLKFKTFDYRIKEQLILK